MTQGDSYEPNVIVTISGCLLQIWCDGLTYPLTAVLLIRRRIQRACVHGHGQGGRHAGAAAHAAADAAGVPHRRPRHGGEAGQQAQAGRPATGSAPAPQLLRTLAVACCRPQSGAQLRQTVLGSLLRSVRESKTRVDMPMQPGEHTCLMCCAASADSGDAGRRARRSKTESANDRSISAYTAWIPRQSPRRDQRHIGVHAASRPKELKRASAVVSRCDQRTLYLAGL